MKILYFAHPECDYGSFMCFDGLCRLLGDGSVFTLPHVRHYYGGIDKDYLLDDGKLGFTAPCEFMLPRDPRNVTIDLVKAVDMREEWDLLVLGSPRTHAKNAARSYIASLGGRQNLRKPFVFCEHEDYDSLCADVIGEFRPDATFKRECTEGKLQPGVIPLPFSAVLTHYTDLPTVPEEEKPIDIFFACGNTSGLRAEVLKRLRELSEKHRWKFVGGGNEFRMDYKTYHESIRKAKIGVSVRGWGRDTVRYWEVPSHPTLLFAGRFDLAIPHPFTHEETAVLFNEDLSDLEYLLKRYLSDEGALIRRRRVAAAGHAHLREFHTTTARARYFLEEVGKIRPLSKV